MTAFDRQAHWQQVYTSKDDQTVSWFEAVPQVSLDLIHATGVGPDAAIVDIGGGASRLVDALLDVGFHDLTVLDLSGEALAKIESAPRRARRFRAVARSRRDHLAAGAALRSLARSRRAAFPH